MQKKYRKIIKNYAECEAHTIEQLITKGSLLRRAFPRGLGSGKNLALRLLEAFRTRPLTREVAKNLAHCRFQIRFCPDTS